LILVDTSIWIDYLSRHPGAPSRRLDELVANGIPFALAPIILQEILQGARTPHEFRKLQRHLGSQHLLFPLHPIDTHIAAADIYYRCRHAGVTPRSSIDCLIARIAIEHDAPLLHNDADYNHIARVIPQLTIY